MKIQSSIKRFFRFSHIAVSETCRQIMLVVGAIISIVRQKLPILQVVISASVTPPSKNFYPVHHPCQSRASSKNIDVKYQGKEQLVYNPCLLSKEEEPSLHAMNHHHSNTISLIHIGCTMHNLFANIFERMTSTIETF